MLSGFKGDALRRTDLKALGGVGILVLLIPGILGNIVYFGKKFLKRAEAGGGIWTPVQRSAAACLTSRPPRHHEDFPYRSL